MAIRNIFVVANDNEILREKCRPVTEFDARLGALLDDMAETMRIADGVGLAAPQVGILRRAVVVDVGDEHGLTELINPTIVKAKGREVGAEGCLSVPGEHGFVARPTYVRVEAQDRFGNKKVYEAEGFRARAFCHEIDHLDGILYIDKLEKEEIE